MREPPPLVARRGPAVIEKRRRRFQKKKTVFTARLARATGARAVSVPPGGNRLVIFLRTRWEDNVACTVLSVVVVVVIVFVVVVLIVSRLNDGDKGHAHRYTDASSVKRNVYYSAPAPQKLRKQFPPANQTRVFCVRNSCVRCRARVRPQRRQYSST